MKNLYHLLLAITFILINYHSRAQSQWTQQGLEFTGTNPLISSMSGRLGALSADGKTAVSFYSNDEAGGGFFVYRLIGAQWLKQAQIYNPGCLSVQNSSSSSSTIKGNMAISADGNTIALSGLYYSNQDSIWIYSFQNNAWGLQARLFTRNSCKTSYQNSSLSYDGNTLLYNGQVWVRSNNIWNIQANLRPIDRPIASAACFDSANRFSGATSCAISADGNTAVVADLSVVDSNTAAWVFVRYGTTWQQQGPRLKIQGVWGFPFSSNSYACPVSISGDGNTLAIANRASARAILYTRYGQVWSRTSVLQFPLLTAGGNLIALSYSGNRLVVNDGYFFASAYKVNGVWQTTSAKFPCRFESVTDSVNYLNYGYPCSMGIDSSGKKVLFGVSGFRRMQGGSWYFTLSGDSVWQLAANRIYEDGSFVGTTEQYHATAMSRDGSTIAVGRDGDDGDVGAVWIFKLQGKQWVQVGPKMLPPIGGAWKPYGFGKGVAFNANASLLFIGAPGANLRENNSYGNVYVYQYNGSTYVPLLDSLIPTQYQDGFGRSIAVSDDGNTLMIANGLIGVHFLLRSGNTWVEEAFFSNPIGFGNITLSGDGNTAVIADELDYSYKGSITIFGRNGGVWTEQATKMRPPLNTSYFPFSKSLSYDGNTLYLAEPSYTRTYYTKRTGSTWSPLDTTYLSNSQTRFVYSSYTGDTLFDFCPSTFRDPKFRFFERANGRWNYTRGYQVQLNTFIGDPRLMSMNRDMNKFSISASHSQGMYGRASTIHVFTPSDLADSTLQIKDASCATVANGKIRLQMLSGTAPYHFNWSNGAPDADSAVNLLPGTYNLTISDAAGDTLYRRYDVRVTNVLSIASCATTFNCNAVAGTAAPNPQGGTAPYTYAWSTSPPQSTPVAVNLQPGLYTCTITDNVGCAYTHSVYIAPVAQAWATINTTVYDCLAPGSAIATMYGGQAPITYSWNTGATDSVIQAYASTTYSVTVTDANGCSVSATEATQSGCLGSIQGDIFFDRNNNCLRDSTEPVTKNYMVLAINVNNGTQTYGITDATGHYYMQVPDTGQYTVTAAQSQACPFSVCTGSMAPVAASVPTIYTHAIADFALTGPEADLTVMDESITPRPGFPFNYRIYYGNRTDSLVAAATVTLVYDSIFKLTNTSPAYTTLDTITHTITWNVTNLGNIYNFTQFVTVGFYVPVPTLLPPMPFSALMHSYITVIPDDCQPANNSISHNFIVVGAYDPNYKEAYPENVLSATDSVITYTIHFQNVGSAPTTFIEIIDTLPAYVNPASLQLVGAFHHPYDFNISGEGILTWRFDPYALPDSASDPIGSQGYVSFAVTVKPGLPTGTLIKNTAHIYFDFNEAVVTNTVVNNIDLCLGLTSPPTNLSAQICSGDTFNFYGQQLSTQGNYQKSFVNVAGCDSLIQLSLQVTPAIITPLSATICSGISYPFKGLNLTTGGTYNDTLTAVNGCDSIVNLTLQIAPLLTTQLTETICSGGSYSFKGQNLTVAGNYADTLTTLAGCDSIVNLTLQIATPLTTQLTETICSGGSYPFKGQNLTVAGNYADTLTTLAGCDSIVNLTLQIATPVTTQLTETICSGGSYSFKGQNLTVAGNYADTLTTLAGCDSIVNLTLQIATPVTTQLTETICSGGSYPFKGQNLTVAGNYADTLTTLAGCDSIVNLTLQIATPLTTQLTETICSGGSYPFKGQSLTVAASYYDTLSTSSGCDSVIQLTLNVLPVLTGTFSDLVCDGKIYLFNNQQLTQAGAYNDTLQTLGGCDSIVTLILYNLQGQNTTVTITIQQDSIYTLPGGGTTTTAGTYYDTLQAASGCDSVITTILSVISSTGNVLGINDAFTLRPNPANDYLLVNTSIEVTDITIYTITGQQVLLLQNPKRLNTALPDYRIDIDKLLPATYLIEVKGDGTAARRRWIKM
jgi:uncharacterized repeat protein (TIGR01451 family)